jgi:hypothetical protein
MVQIMEQFVQRSAHLVFFHRIRFGYILMIGVIENLIEAAEYSCDGQTLKISDWELST